MNEFWHEKKAYFKDDRVVVKLAKEDGSFKGSVVIPTDYYPLNGRYETFTYKNTEQIKDEGVLSVFDKVKYHVGHCYTNTEELVARLVECGYDVKSYVGWLFTSVTEFPIHHCWAVLRDDDGVHVLDLADDASMMLYGDNGKHFEEAKSVEETRELMVSFQKAASKVPNRVRCYPVGVPTRWFLYVGCECSPYNGKYIYNDLLARYPRHECERNCDANGWNATQKLMAEHGLM